MISAAIHAFIIGIRIYLICTAANAKANNIEFGIKEFKFDWLFLALLFVASCLRNSQNILNKCAHSITKRCAN